eukprot:124579-Prorocentrum_minimum.AAC.1
MDQLWFPGYTYGVPRRVFGAQSGAHVAREPLGGGYTLKMMGFPKAGFTVGLGGKRQVRARRGGPDGVQMGSRGGATCARCVPGEG